MVSFPYYSHTTPTRIPKDMGIVWETYHKGVPLLGIPENTLDRWWQLKYFRNFHPETWGRFPPNLTVANFSDGLKLKPPTIKINKPLSNMVVVSDCFCSSLPWGEMLHFDYFSG